MEHLLLFGNVAVRLLLALCIGGGIGWERARAHHPAGVRTHMLVTIGAAVIMLLGGQTVGEFVGTANSDPARLGAQVISGIGFLGAGTIMKKGRSVRGLTTAATLWVSACLGLAVGAGQYIISLGGFAVAMLALRMFKFPRFDISFLYGRKDDCLTDVCQALELQQANISNFSSRDVDETHIRVHFELYLGVQQRNISTADMLYRLSQIPHVSCINIDALWQRSLPFYHRQFHPFLLVEPPVYQAVPPVLRIFCRLSPRQHPAQPTACISRDKTESALQDPQARSWALASISVLRAAAGIPCDFCALGVAYNHANGY